jgi:S-DNA-T family DNA segregation ATPase FtsK/SpoIIIE
MTESKPQNNPPPNEPRLKRRLFGLLLFPIALFPFFALVTYNWHDMPQFAVPPLTPSSNLIGVVGDVFAYTGYRLIGLAIWSVPLLCVLAGVLFMAGRSLHPGRRALGFLIFIFSATCFLQLLGHTPGVTRILHALNIEPNAGGAVGYIVMTKGLAQFLSPFGAGVLMALLMLWSILFAIGFRNILRGLGFLTEWAAAREPSDEERAQREEAIAAAKAAKAAAKAEREIEKQRIAAERDAELKAKADAKAQAKAAREEEKERERLRQEAERQAVMAAREAVLSQRRAQQPPANPPTNAQPSGNLPPSPSQKEPTANPSGNLSPSPSRAGAVEEPPEDKGPYLLPPPSDVLSPVPPSTAEHGDVEAMERRLVDTLKVFGVDVQPAFRVTGPVVTQYALTLAPGVKPERISSLSNAIQMALEAKSLRIQAPIPGKNAVGIEVPNTKPASVCFREIIDGDLWKKNSPGKFQVPLLLGKDAAGNDLIADLAKLPHLLVAGATGQGKSVCLNSIINGLLMCRTPEQLKLIMVDPKRVEFTSYNKLPHLLVPIINDTKKVVFALRSAVVEMDRRLKMFSRAGCRNIVDFNNRKTVVQPDMLGGGDELVGDPDMPRTVPYIVIVIDEVADVMQAAKKEVEPVIARLTALARATGIHLILATQRPDANIITGVIKSNIPGRIAFKTSSSIDSRTILDATGSELLIGKGDMLFRMSDGRLLRAQGSYISDEEIGRIVDFIGEHSTVQFDEKLTKRMEKIKEADIEDELDGGEEGEEGGEQQAIEPRGAAVGGIPPPAGMSLNKEEALYRNALEVLRDTKRASISHFQRRMGIGYNHAARIVDLLEERGVIGAAKSGAGPREILLDPEALLNEMDGAAPAADPDQVSMPADGTGDDDPFGFPPEG